MGARSSKQEVKVPHFFFGEVTQHNEFNREVIVVSKQMLRKDEYDDWLVKYGEAKSMKKQSLLLPESYEIETVKKFFACCQCPADFQMSLSYEKFEYLFKSELVQRRNSKNFYKMSQLFLILYNCSVGLKEFQLIGQRLGDLRPSQIVITNQKCLKMINVASFPWELSSMDKILEKYDNKTKFYLAPEEIDFLNNRTKSKVSDSKAQSFSLGMTILEAATLQNSEDLYGFNPRTIDLAKMESRLSEVQKKYPILHKYLTQILAQKPEQRLSGGELWAILHIYSQKIAQNQNFSRDQTKERNSLIDFRKRPQK